MDRVTVLTRSFQRGVGEGGKEFDIAQFREKVAKPIRALLGFTHEVGEIIVAVNGEPGSPLAEIPDRENLTPTIRALLEEFSGSDGGGVLPLLCRNWGKNPGSATALNDGARFARSQGAKRILCWSPEIEMDGNRIAHALSFATDRKLSVVGFLRKRWWELPQYHVAQNTAALWDVEALHRIDYFSHECNGTGRTVHTAEYGDVALAGMEDYHAMLRLARSDSDFYWGNIGCAFPLRWDTSFERGSERERDHLRKVARQYEVMRAYAKDIFPERSFEDVMELLFARYHQDR